MVKKIALLICFATVLLAGALLFRKPAVAQPPATYTLVRNADEPARNPYQEEHSAYVGSGEDPTDLIFSKVPAGKRLVVTHMSAWYEQSAGQNTPVRVPVRLVIGNSAARDTPAGQFIPPSILPGGTDVVVNADTVLYFNAGEEPIALFNRDSLSAAIVTLSGYMVSVP